MHLRSTIIRYHIFGKGVKLPPTTVGWRGESLKTGINNFHRQLSGFMNILIVGKSQIKNANFTYSLFSFRHSHSTDEWSKDLKMIGKEYKRPSSSRGRGEHFFLLLRWWGVGERLKKLTPDVISERGKMTRTRWHRNGRNKNQQGWSFKAAWKHAARTGTWILRLSLAKVRCYRCRVSRSGQQIKI